ncbi:MAG: hypothetical protein U5N27_03090 [Rhizobium sp.]|nr:hypothetical protein [Rhizobium sp.]
MAPATITVPPAFTRVQRFGNAVLVHALVLAAQDEGAVIALAI